MNTILISSVVLYLLGTLGLGVWAGTRIKDTSDFAVAGRSLPLIMSCFNAASRRVRLK